MLATLDQATGAATVVGDTQLDILGFDVAAGLTYRWTEDLLYAYLEGGDSLGTIDPITALAAFVGDTQTDGCCGGAIAFSPLDVLWRTGDGPLETLNPASGRATYVADLVFSAPADNDPRINGMDYHPANGMLFGALNDGSGGSPENYLSLVDTDTGVVTILGMSADGLDGLAWVAQRDTDGDGLGDQEEVALGTDPMDPDTDGGGRTDGEEVLLDGTDPLNPADDI